MSTNEQEEPRSRLDQLADEWLDGRRTAGQVEDMPVDELLNRLVADPEGLTLHHLLALSDLSREQTVLVKREWPTIPADRRRTIVRYLIELSEDDLSWQFGQLLRVALDDNEADIRRMAIDGLNTDGDLDAELIGPFVSILQSDPDPRPRVAAAQALGAYVLAGELEEMDAAIAMRAEEALLAIVSNVDMPYRLRGRSLESLAYSGEVGIRQLIEDAYYSSNEEMRVSALNAMGRSADIRWRGLVRAELRNPATAMRAAAAAACGELEAKAALDDLVELVGDEERDVKLAAIFALGQIGGQAARDILETVRLSDEEEEVAAADDALEELMIFESSDGDHSPFEETDAEWEADPWDQPYDYDDDDLGEYEE